MSEGGICKQFLGNISGSQIEASGDVIAFGSSDRNLKDNIQPIENPLEKMERLVVIHLYGTINNQHTKEKTLVS